MALTSTLRATTGPRQRVVPSAVRVEMAQAWLAEGIALSWEPLWRLGRRTLHYPQDGSVVLTGHSHTVATACLNIVASV